MGTTKLKKTLYVGLGGTGVQALLKIKKCFVDSYGEIPPMIGFLAIDTDGAASNKSVTSNRGVEVKLEQGELLVCTVKGALSVYKANPKTYDWLPSKNIDKLSAIAGGGAGQVRSNGRFIAYYNNEKISGNIQAAIDKINKLIPQNSEYAVDTNKEGLEYPINVNVLASIAGGTGSGMLVDVLCIIRSTLNKKSQAFKLYPWIVLPEVFKAMSMGPSMANVLYNSYGALRTLDYIMHYDPKTPAINFGYTKIDEPLFDYAYIINNTNQAGVSFSDKDDLIDVIAKSAFLPANKMGDDLASPFDNIVAQKMGGTYDILNKKAWAASVGSAELIYDGQAVGNVIAYATITQLCNYMLQPSTDNGSDAATKFVDDQDVSIRENEGRDDVINALLSPDPEYSITIDENTTDSDITTYIEGNCGQIRLKEDLKKRLNKKLSNTSKQFEQYIKNFLIQGRVGEAINFINSLSSIISSCKDEMNKEQGEYNKSNSIPKQWSEMLNATRLKGIKKLLKSKNPIDEEAVAVLIQNLNETIKNNREEIRREWAIKFYNTFEETIQQKLNALDGFRAKLDQIKNDCTRKSLVVQNKSVIASKFQIFLHDTDVKKTYTIDDATRTKFVEEEGKNIVSWVGQSQESIYKNLWDFAKDTKGFLDAVNTDIDTILRALPEEKVEEYIEHLKVLASPLWTYNTQGYNTINLQLDRFVIVGVGDGNKDSATGSVLCKDRTETKQEDGTIKKEQGYRHCFTINGHKPEFASIKQTDKVNDRVYLLMVEDLLPIYAVNNFSTYQRDSDEKVAKGFMMANYLDEKLNNRMNAENFSVVPAIETDDVLQYWVWGFVFDYIHYDNEDNQYWIRSKSHGDALRKYRFDLSHQRDVAFDIFRSECLYKEVEEALNRQIAKTGRQPIEDKIAQIKSEDSYLEQYAQLSPLEEGNLSEPKFKAVRDLIEQEINLMSE